MKTPPVRRPVRLFLPSLEKDSEHGIIEAASFKRVQRGLYRDRGWMVSGTTSTQKTSEAHDQTRDTVPYRWWDNAHDIESEHARS